MSIAAGWEGDEALKRSDEMTKVKGVKKALLWPYVGLICGMRLVSMGRTPILAALPAHIIREVPEIPFTIYTSLLFLSVVLSRYIQIQTRFALDCKFLIVAMESCLMFTSSYLSVAHQ